MHNNTYDPKTLKSQFLFPNYKSLLTYLVIYFVQIIIETNYTAYQKNPFKDRE